MVHKMEGYGGQEELNTDRDVSSMETPRISTVVYIWRGKGCSRPMVPWSACGVFKEGDDETHAIG